jgi:hypothetical protein
MLKIIPYILRSWEKDTTMPHACAPLSAAACMRACRDGKGFVVHRLREFTSIFMVHYPVSAQAL